MAVMAPNDTFGLAEEAASLDLTYMDVDAIKAFNKNRKEIKRWGTATVHRERDSEQTTTTKPN
jgi:hypothetical protein